MAEEIRFTLDTFEEKGVVQVANFDNVLIQTKKIVEHYPIIFITNDEEKREYKEVRAKINKIIDLVDRRRIDTSNDVLRTFVTQCKEITDILDEHQKSIGKSIKTYEDSLKEVVVDKPKVITATLKYKDAKLNEKIKAFCEKNNIELSIK